MIFHVVLMISCQTVMFTTAQYLMLFSMEEMSECNFLGQVLSSDKMWISIINGFVLHPIAFPQQIHEWASNDMYWALSDTNQKDHVGHKENQWGPSNCQPLYLKKIYNLSSAKFNMRFLSWLFCSYGTSSLHSLVTCKSKKEGMQDVFNHQKGRKTSCS